MGAPAEFGRLQAFGNEALDGPGVPEGFHRLRILGALGVALGDVDALHAGLLHQLGPAFAIVGGGLLKLHAEILGEIDQRLLDEPGDHAGVGAAAGDGRGATGMLADFLTHGFAQRVVGARRIVGLGVEVEAEPGLYHGVDVRHVDLAAEAHQVQRRGVDGEVDAEALAFAFGEEGRQQVLVVVLGHGFRDEAHAMIFGDLGVVTFGVRVDDDHAGLVELEMALDEGKRSPADRSESDHDDGTGDLSIDGVFLIGHFICSCIGLHARVRAAA